MPDASPRSVTNSPESFHVSQSCGRHTRATRAQASGSERCNHDSFVIVNAATGTDPHAVRPRRLARRPPSGRELLDEPAGVGCRLRVVPQLGRTDHTDRRRRARRGRAAGRRPTTAATSVERRHPTCANAACNASHHASGSCSLPRRRRGRMRRAAAATSAPVSASRTSTLVDCVDESTPRNSGMRAPAPAAQRVPSSSSVTS